MAGRPGAKDRSRVQDHGQLPPRPSPLLPSLLRAPPALPLSSELGEVCGAEWGGRPLAPQLPAELAALGAM